MAKTAKSRKSTSRPSTSRSKRSSSKASSSRSSASKATQQASSYARQASNAAQNAGAEAMKNWSNMLQQSPFKMEGFDPKSFSMPSFGSMPSMPSMNSMPSFPQFDQFKSKSQDAANQYNSFLNKATAAAEKSRNRLAAGAEECSKTIASITQSNVQRANEALRSLMACKSLNEYADVQNRLFKQNFEAMSSETAKLVEQVTKTVASASEPLNDLAASAMTEAKKSMAA